MKLFRVIFFPRLEREVSQQQCEEKKRKFILKFGKKKSLLVSWFLLSIQRRFGQIILLSQIMNYTSIGTTYPKIIDWLSWIFRAKDEAGRNFSMGRYMDTTEKVMLLLDKVIKNLNILYFSFSGNSWATIRTCWFWPMNKEKCEELQHFWSCLSISIHLWK